MVLEFFLKVLVFIIFIVIMPLILFSMLIVFFEDGSPVFFTQKRLGKNQRIFTLFKIRTMKKDTPNLGTHEISQKNYLKFGVIIRKLKIDELPQIINYLSGDLELVGPRPGLPNQKALRDAREKKKIFKIKPGITGLGQILGFDMSNPKLLSEIDHLYIKRKSILFDINILMATFVQYFKIRLYNKLKKEIYTIKEQNAEFF